MHLLGGRREGSRAEEGGCGLPRWHPDAAAYCTYVGINNCISGKYHLVGLAFYSYSTCQAALGLLHAGSGNNNDQGMDCTHAHTFWQTHS